MLPVNLLVQLRPEQSAAFGERAAAGTAIVLLVLALWTNRVLALHLIRSPAGQNGT